VYVQRRNLAGRRGQDECEQNRDRAIHKASVCNGGCLVKRRCEKRGSCKVRELIADQLHLPAECRSNL
jgi:hypothetical protein